MSAISSTGLTKTDLLFLAIKLGQSSSIQEYLKGPDSANLNAVMFGKTPLYMAIEKADYIAIDILLHGKADVNGICRGVIPLELAISLGSSESVKKLLDAKADPYAKNSNGTTMPELTESIKRIQDQMAIIELIKKAQRELFKTPLHIAVERADCKEIDMLLRSKADVEEVYGGVTPLELAISLGSSESVKELLDAKADPNAKNSNGTSMLELTESVSSPLNRMVIFELIKKAQYELLYMAAERGNAIAIDILSKVKDVEDISITPLELFMEWLYKTPLYVAVERGNAAAIDTLSKAKADVEEVCRGVTPLELAISLGNIVSVQALLDAKADPNAKNSNGTSMLELTKSVDPPLSIAIIELIKKAQLGLLYKTPLHMAVGRADGIAIDILSKANADVEGICGGVTPLELAISLGNIVSVRALLDAKADPNAENSKGTSMLELAERVKSSYYRKVIVESIKEAQCEWKPLHMAVKKADSIAINILSKATLEKHTLLSSDCHLLKLAVSLGSVVSVKALLDAKANPYAVETSLIERSVKIKSSYYRKAIVELIKKAQHESLYMAVKERDCNRINILSKSKADIEGICRGVTPLELAISLGNIASVEELLDAKADPYAKNSNGTSMLELAKSVKLDFCRTRITKPIKQAQFYMAVEKSDCKEIDILLHGKADVEGKCRDVIPLELAISLGSIESVKKLLDAKASPYAKNSNGTRILEFAERVEHTIMNGKKIVELIKNAASPPIRFFSFQLDT